MLSAVDYEVQVKLGPSDRPLDRSEMVFTGRWSLEAFWPQLAPGPQLIQRHVHVYTYHWSPLVVQVTVLAFLIYTEARVKMEEKRKENAFDQP